MAMKRIVVDKASVALYMGMTKDDQVFSLAPDDIQRIQIEKTSEFSWFRKVSGEKITIYTSKAPLPFVFTRKKNRQYYDEYKAGLTQFAKANYVTFQDAPDD